MLAKSAPGTLCPKENDPRSHIGDDAFVEVPDTAYYHRLVDDGSLLLEPSEPSATPQGTSKGGPSK